MKTSLARSTSSFLIAATISTSLLSGSQSSFAATQIKNKTPKPTPIDALANAQSKYKNTTTMTAQFNQIQKSATLGTTKESLGRIFIKRPNKFFWQTEEPEKSILVGNGTKVWFYTPPFREGEKGQVVVRKAADVQSRLAIDLLAGQTNLKKEFNIKELSKESFQLIPRKPTADIARIELYIERPTNLVYKLILFTTTGNQTALTLKNVILGPSLSDSMFNFTPPENTEEIK